MRGRSDDHELVSALRPLDVAAYLRAQGWAEMETSISEPLMAWEKSIDGSVVDVLVPRHPTWRDYARSMDAVVQMLADVEERSRIAVIRDISQVTADVVRLRAINGKNDGTISLLEGVRLPDAGRALLLSAACSAIRPRRAYHSRKPAQAEKYIQGLRLGQTERGSYIVTILSHVGAALAAPQLPLPFDGSSEPLDFGEEPFPRRVVRTLGIALERVKRAAERGVSTGEFAAFEEEVKHGVSADLCEAIGFLGESEYINALDIRIGWAPARPIESGVPSRTEFSKDVLEVIREGGRLLRAKNEIDDFDLIGPVVDVTRPDPAIQGKAIVYGSVDGQPRKVRVELSGENWNRANEAMRRRDSALLRCTGELVRVGKSFELKNARDVDVVDDNDELATS